MNIEDDTKSALPPWLCKDDAAEQNEKYYGDTSLEQLNNLHILETQSSDIYICKKVWVNLRQHIVTVKLEQSDGPNNVTAALQLQQWAESAGFTKSYINKTKSVVFTAKRDKIAA